ncbi:flagellar brake protein [Salinispirillum sp. LH 10-3-1]|uniref:Flagellar brake protein n=1 Tax=Salinispirillum sp. LH 10-3-1 TaxID=2952525 RepID=A0AB38YGZ0_9GAMM
MDTQGTEGQFIKSSSEIARLLRHVQQKLSPVTISFSGMSRTLTSYVISVDGEKKNFLIDEVLPANHNALMQEGRAFNFESYYDGCRLRGRNVKASAQKDQDGNLVYLVPFPNEIHYYQRRQSYRATVRVALNIFVRLLDDNGNLIRGKLRDLSAEGCKIEIDGYYVDVLTEKTEQKPVRMLFPNNTEISLNLIMRHVFYDEARKQTHCGCQFKDLTPHEDDDVANVVSDLQRDHINFVKNGGLVSGIPARFLPPDTASEKAALDSKLAAGGDPEAPPPPPPKQKSQKDKARALRARTAADRDYRTAHQAGVSAVRALVAKLRGEQELPIDQAMEAAQDLAEVWSKDRQQLMLLTRVRSAQDYLFEHSVSVGLTLADQVIRGQEKDDTELLKRLIFAGLTHDLARAMLPDGVQDTRIKLPPDRSAQLQKNAHQVRSVLTTLPQVPREAIIIATQNYERLDGSGIPDRLTSDEIHPLGKLAAVVDVFDMLSNRVGRDVYYHPVLAFKAMLNMPKELDSDIVKRLIRTQGLYPLGSAVKLDNDHVGLVMRHNDDNKPSHVRLVYNIPDDTQFPPRDIDLTNDAVNVEGPADPIKLGLSNSLLRLPLQQ